MGTPIYEPEYYYISGIYFSEIVFDETEKVSVFGYMLDAKTVTPKNWTLFCDFSQLTDMLLSLGERGDMIIHELSKILSEQYEIPTIIKIQDYVSETLFADNVVLKVYVPHELNEMEEWVPTDDNFLFIETIESKEEFIKKNQSPPYISCVKNGKLMKDLLDEALNNLNDDSGSKELEGYLAILETTFKTYKYLVEKGFSEKKARKNSGLQDELLFKIALAHHKCFDG